MLPQNFKPHYFGKSVNLLQIYAFSLIHVINLSETFFME